jgi:hypothetical protein
MYGFFRKAYFCAISVLGIHPSHGPHKVRAVYAAVPAKLMARNAT